MATSIQRLLAISAALSIVVTMVAMIYNEGVYSGGDSNMEQYISFEGQNNSKSVMDTLKAMNDPNLDSSTIVFQQKLIDERAAAKLSFFNLKKGLTDMKNNEQRDLYETELERRMISLLYLITGGILLALIALELYFIFVSRKYS